MAEAPSNAVVGYPTREIRITGERVAQMLHTVIQVSRFETKLIELTMKGKRESRALVRSASERFSRALNSLEDELKEAERELAIAARPADRNSKPARKNTTGQNGQARNPSPPAAAKQASQATPPVKPAKPATPSQPAPQASQQAAPKEAPKPAGAERTQQPGGQGGKQKAQGGQGQNAGGNGGQAPKAKEPKANNPKHADKGEQAKDQVHNDRAPIPQVASTTAESVVQHDATPVL